jgi:acyl-CoA thioesterase-2
MSSGAERGAARICSCPVAVLPPRAPTGRPASRASPALTRSDGLRKLLDLLDLEDLEVNLFRGRSPDEDRQRVFGGQVLAQALAAARRTVDPERAAHSFHSYFLRAGDPAVPILYQVDRIRDGRSFTTRRVVAIQHGHAIFNMSASFQVDEPSEEHQVEMPEVPPPEELPDDLELAERFRADAPEGYVSEGGWFDAERPIEQRYADPINWWAPERQAGYQRIWLRTTGALPDDPALHAIVLAYASDMSLLDAATMPTGLSYFDEGMQIASLDHAMWFHRRFRADEWLLYVSDSPTASGSRGFARGSVFDREGRLVASVAQEGLMRKR